MKKLLLLLPAIFFLVFNSYSQVLKKLGDKVKNKSEQKADQKVYQEIDKGLDKTDDASKKKENNSTTTSNTNSTKDTSATPVPAAPTLKVYSNYDFVPGDKILFEDHFTDDQDGEFATHWELKWGRLS